MRLSSSAADASPAFSKFTLSLASTLDEVREVQRLRYKIFIEAMGLHALVNGSGLDVDEFDAYCDHLVVRDNRTLKVVGTYRLLGPEGASRIGKYYSDVEFDLGRMHHLRGSIVEAGRACIHPDYRGGGVIMLLWTGLAAYMRRHQCDYLVGCASVSLSDGGLNASAIYRSLQASQLAPSEYSVVPRIPFPLRSEDTEARVPPLLKGYLRSGAMVCGAPAWDADFHCADFFLLLPLARLDARYARHYLAGEERAQPA